MRILVVEDNVDLSVLIESMLEPHNIEVKVVNNSKDAIRHFAESKYDAALCDICLPDGDGLEILAHFRTYSPDCMLIGMSGYIQDAADYLCYQLDLDDFIYKPFRQDDLLRALRVSELIESQAA